MTRPPRSIPFSVSILTLLALVVLPLSASLMWLGWRAVGSLEQQSADQRIASLERAVASFLIEGMRTIVSVGHTLATQPPFASEAAGTADEERRRQLAGVLGRHPAVAAVFVGYEDGRFYYAGHLSQFSAEQQIEFGRPPPGATVVRTIAGEGGARREAWRIALPDGTTGAQRIVVATFDPRERPWYVETTSAGQPILTEPYRFAWSQEPGITAGVPVRGGGVIGFDFTLGTLARLLAEYRVTPSTIVMLSTGGNDVLIESEACTGETCASGSAAAQRTLRQVATEAATSRQNVDREEMLDGHRWRLIVRPMPPLLGRAFAVAAAMPIEELSASSQALLRRAAMMAAIAVALAIGATLIISLLLSRSLRLIAAKTERIRNLDFSDTQPVMSRITEILRLSQAVERMREGLQVFGRYVSRDLVTQIMRAPDSAGLGGVRRELTVMFTDIEAFSRISEHLEPELLTDRLSRYFEALGAEISANKGTIDKYIGDSIMAFWNAPETDPDHIAHACRAALAAARASRELGDKWRQLGRPAFHTRFGLHTGPAVVGNVGARERINYTLVGAVANQASRLEALNKVYATEILASGTVAAPTRDQFVWRHVDRIVAAGMTEAMDLYEPMGLAGDDSHTGFLAAWDAGRAAYLERHFSDAARHFVHALELKPNDGPCKLFVHRCQELAAAPPADDWTGVWHYDRK